MTPEEFASLDKGDLVRHVSDSHAWIVSGNYGTRVIAVATRELTNPIEWMIVQKADYNREGEQQP